MKFKSLLFLLSLIPGCGCASEDIRVGLLDNRPPYSDFNTNHQLQGAAADLLNALAASNGLKFTTQVASSHSQLVQMLKDRRIQIALLPPQSSPPPRDILVSHSLLQQHWALVVREYRLPLQQESSLDLRHQRVMILRHSPALAGLLSTYPGVDINEVNTLHEAYRLLNAGAAQAIVCDSTQAALLASNLYPGILSVRPLPTIVSRQYIWLAPGQDALLHKINHAIDTLPAGITQSINERWLLNATLSGMQPTSVSSAYWINPLIAMSSVLSLFLIGFLLTEIFRRHRAERSLSDALKYWQTLLNSIPTPLLVCDPLGSITHCNHALLTSLALTQQQVIGNSLENFTALNPIIPTISEQERIAAIGNMQPQFSDRTIVTQGNHREIVQWLAAYSDSRMTPQGLLLGWFDISERKRLERDLADALQRATNANREKSQFLARMSHEIRSPMNAILGILELETQRITTAESSLPIAYAASRQLLQIIGDVLDISKIEAGEMELHPQPTDVGQLLLQVINTYATLAAQKSLRLDSDIEAVWHRRYLVDGTKLIQIINNLLSNAIKYTFRGFVALQVYVQSYDHNRDTLIFSISDSGIGIDKALQQKILQPYVQIESNVPSSTGLGLAICTQLVQLMDGELHIDSTPQCGSVFSFTLTLPRVTAAIEEVQEMQLIPIEEKSLSIIVVDDSPANLTVMKLQLEKLGHQVTTCDNGRQALFLLEQAHFDLMLTDCQMPVLNGYQLTQQQRERENGHRRYLPIIGCTANAFTDEQYRCLVAGMDAVLIKPLTQQDLRILLSEQQAIRLDFREIRLMTDEKAPLIASLIDELQRSSEADRQQLLAKISIPDEFEAILHRQKGSFALAGYHSGVSFCQQMEQSSPHFTKFAVDILRLNSLILRFIALLEQERQKLSIE